MGVFSREDTFARLEPLVGEIVGRDGLRDDLLMEICVLLKENVPYYDWVGFYLVSEKKEKTLVLGPFVGAETEHTIIVFGKGICGQAADREETFVVQDVSEENNYLPCDVKVKSEIVLPVFKDGRVVGELDIDSYSLAPFEDEDQAFLESVAKKVSRIF